jgi:hypothetical protein
MNNTLPTSLAEKAVTFPECSYGACKAKLVLNSGKVISNVTLAWGSEIVKLNGMPITSTSNLPFDLKDVVDVLPQEN